MVRKASHGSGCKCSACGRKGANQAVTRALQEMEKWEHPIGRFGRQAQELAANLPQKRKLLVDSKDESKRKRNKSLPRNLVVGLTPEVCETSADRRGLPEEKALAAAKVENFQLQQELERSAAAQRAGKAEAEEKDRLHAEAIKILQAEREHVEKLGRFLFKGLSRSCSTESTFSIVC